MFEHMIETYEVEAIVAEVNVLQTPAPKWKLKTPRFGRDVYVCAGNFPPCFVRETQKRAAAATNIKETSATPEQSFVGSCLVGEFRNLIRAELVCVSISGEVSIGVNALGELVE